MTVILQVSLESGVNDIYLITDGTAVSCNNYSTPEYYILISSCCNDQSTHTQDHTHDFLLSQLLQLRRWFGDRWRVNTIAFHCTLEWVSYLSVV